MFGSWARGEASANSDLGVAVILAADVDRYGEKLAVADLAYDAIVETGIHVEPWPVPTDGLVWGFVCQAIPPPDSFGFR